MSSVSMTRSVCAGGGPAFGKRRFLACSVALFLAAPLAAKGQLSIDLVPRDAGPFLGGETVTVDVIVKNPQGEWSEHGGATPFQQ